jgi:hypothetical protein
VTNLRSTIEEMENIFLAYNERAMTSGIMHKNPDLARDLKAATEAFITLAKNNHSDDDGEQWSGEELEDVPRKPQGTYAHDMATLLGFNANQKVTSSSPEPGLELQGPEDSVMGYNFQDIYNNPRDKKIARTSSPMYAATQGSQLSMMSTTAELIPGFFAATAGLNANPLSVTSGPDALGGMSRQVIPTTPGDRADLLKIKSLAAPYTYSFEESTFARRLQRASIERGFHLITNAETRPSVFLRVFRLSLLYHTREALGMKFQKALSRSTEEPLETFQTPFIHLGGAGMHYNTGRIRNGYIVKPGPLQQRATLESTESPGAVMDIEFDLSDYEGEWFDSNDVEGYLNEKGLFIDPQSSFAEGQISVPNGSTLGSFFNSDSPPANIFDSPSSRPNDIDLHSLTAAGSTASPSTPVMSESAMDLGTQGLFPELGAASPNTLWNNAAADWLMGSGNKTPDFLESGWSSYNKFSSWDMLDAVGMVDGYAPSNIMPAQQTSKKQVTVDVSRFIDGECYMSVYESRTETNTLYRIDQDCGVSWTCAWLQKEGC